MPSNTAITIGFNDKDIKKLAKRAVQLGWRVEMTKGNHVRWLAPDGKTILLSSLTGSACGWRNFKADLRKHGVVLSKHDK